MPFSGSHMQREQSEEMVLPVPVAIQLTRENSADFNHRSRISSTDTKYNRHGQFTNSRKLPIYLVIYIIVGLFPLGFFSFCTCFTFTTPTFFCRIMEASKCTPITDDVRRAPACP
jgi:hypothetical protein